VLPTLLRAFAQGRPEADIRIQIRPSGEVVRAVARGEVHLGIAGQSRGAERLVADTVLRDELTWVASARSLSPPAITILDVEDLTIVVAGRDSSTRSITERILGQVHLRPSRLIELDSIEAIKRAVGAGVGVALLSRLSVADALGTGELREIDFLGSPPAVRPIQILRTADWSPTPLQRAFEGLLRLHCAGLRPAARDLGAAADG
jgi:DNA-binding transcriptional LysR family regulator